MPEPKVAVKIYVVMGATGQWSDRSEWIVTAYMREDDAKLHVAKATEYAKAWELRIQKADWADMDCNEQDRQTSAANPTDPKFSMDYSTDYWHEETELQNEFREVERTN